jgi:hypothetical protein
MTLREYIRLIVNDNSGGIKLTDLVTKVTVGYYENEFQHPAQVTVEEIIHEADKDFGILYYSFGDREKVFVYQK